MLLVAICFWTLTCTSLSKDVVVYKDYSGVHRGNLLGCDYSLFYGIFPLPYCKVLLAKTSETIIIQTISVLFCVLVVSIIVYCFYVNVKNNIHYPPSTKDEQGASVGSVGGGEIVTTLSTSKKLKSSLS